MALDRNLEGVVARANRAFSNRASELAEAPFEISARRYLDPEFFQRELSLFRAGPVPLAPLGLWRTTGFFPVEGNLREGLLLTGSPEHEPRVIANRCRHRAARILDKEACEKKIVACPYHGWTYDMDGKLCSVFGKEHGLTGLEDVRLDSYPATKAGGFVWTTLTGEQRSLHSGLEELDTELSWLGVETPRLVEEFELECAFNWKLGVEAFLEVYHFKTAHRVTLPNLENYNIALFDFSPRLTRITVPLKEVDKLTRDSLQESCHFMYFVFPNHFFLMFKGHFGWLSILPETVERSRLRYRGHTFVDSAPEELVEKARQSVRFLKTVDAEDVAICGTIQRNLRASDRFKFTRYEPAIQRFHWRLESELGGTVLI